MTNAVTFQLNLINAFLPHTGLAASEFPINIDNKYGCLEHIFSLNADELEISHTMNMIDANGYRAIRTNDGWAAGDVHYLILNGKLVFGVHGNNPGYHIFAKTFEKGHTYNMKLVYSKSQKKVDLYVDGQKIETNTFQSTRTAQIRNGHVGCWKMLRRFAGVINNLRMDTATISTTTTISTYKPSFDLHLININI